MSEAKILASPDAAQEIAALIETLHQTERRLHELTAGEVDAVSDQEGRTILLRKAQEQLRHVEEAKQACILNTLPASIAMLDKQGVIVSVNDAWRRIGWVNALQGQGHGIGINYLQVCDRARGENAAEARQVAAGIRSVLSGHARSFAREYAFHLPNEQRWLQMTVTPLADGASSGVIVMHIDSSERKRAESAQLRLAGAMDVTDDAIYLVDRTSMKFIYINAAACRMREHTREEIFALGPAGVIAMPVADLERSYDRIIESGEPGAPIEIRRLRADGSALWMELRRQAQRNGDGWLVITVVRDITEQKQVAMALLQSENLKRAILASSVDSIVATDHEGKIVEFNLAAEAAFGVPSDVAIGKSMAELIIPPRMREAHARGLAHYLATGDGPVLGKRVELAAIRADGSEFPIELTVAVISGTPKPMFTGFIRDITVQQANQKRLRESEARFRSLSALSTDWFWEQDDQYRFVSFADGDSQALWSGLPPISMGLRRWELPGVSAPMQVWQEHKELIEARKPFRDLEYQRTFDDGSVKYITASGEPLFDASGGFTGYRGVATDITERKLREIALRESEKKFHQLADNISDVFWIRSADLSEVHYVSPAFEKIWGRSVASLKKNPQRWRNFVHPADRARVVATFATLRNEADSLDFEYRIVRPDGELRWVHVRGFPVRDGTGKLIRLAGIVRDITVQRQNDQAFRRQHTELRLLFDLMPAMIWFKDTKNRILRVNQRVADAAGKSIAQIEGRPFLEIYPHDAARFFADDLKVIESGMPRLGIVETLTDADGKQRWVQTDKVPHFDESHKVAGIVVMAQDITARVEAALALQASLAEFRSLAESMPQIVWITRPDGWNLYFNQQWMDYTGLSFEDGMGEGWIKPFHPDDRQRAADAWHEATTSTGVYNIECRFRRADGVYRWWLIRGVPIRDSAGTILKWFGTCTDIHEIKMAVEEIAHTSLALRESERRFSDLLRNVELASFMLDLEARITFCNDYLLRLTGWKYEEVIGRNWFELFTPSQSDIDKESFTKLLKNQSEQWNRESQILTRSGEQRLMRWNNSVLRSGTGEVIGAASIGEDITDRKRAEQEILRLNADLENRVEARTAELQAVNQELEAFDYSISHDLKAPIRHVDGFSTMLLEDYGDKLDAHGRSCVMRIQSAAKRMDQLVGDLLALSLVSRGELHRTDVDVSLLARLVFAVLRQSEPDRVIDFVVAPDIKVKADAGLLRIVLDNLFGNARKFTANRVDAKIEFGCALIDGTPTLFVRDNGAGFDAAYADKLFAPFQRLHAQSEFTGTGIGLATVRRIITRHGGQVWAEGAVNKGATIYFTLPQ